MTPVRLTKIGRAGLKAVLDADQLDRYDSGLRAPGWDAVVDLPDEWVEPVKPPLPAEPAPGTYMVSGNLRTVVVVWLNNLTFPWQITGRSASCGWPSVLDWVGRDHGVLVTRQVPAPEPVTLPWLSGPLKRVRDIGDVYRETHVWVGHGNEVRERIDRSGTGAGPQELIAVHTPESARAKAYALLTAADQAEGTDRG